jgi:hypothetical protein
VYICAWHLLRDVDSGERLVIILRSRIAFLNGCHCVDKSLKRPVPVPLLAGEHAVRWRVFHEERVDGGESILVGRDVVAPVGLVDRHLATLAHVEKAL